LIATVENLAVVFFERIAEGLKNPRDLLKVRVHQGASTAAEYENPSLIMMIENDQFPHKVER
jgi:hypothetical protein